MSGNSNASNNDREQQWQYNNNDSENVSNSDSDHNNASENYSDNFNDNDNSKNCDNDIDNASNNEPKGRRPGSAGLLTRIQLGCVTYLDWRCLTWTSRLSTWVCSSSHVLWAFLAAFRCLSTWFTEQFISVTSSQLIYKVGW